MRASTGWQPEPSAAVVTPKKVTKKKVADLRSFLERRRDNALPVARERREGFLVLAG
jgi:hypothetical protein